MSIRIRAQIYMKSKWNLCEHIHVWYSCTWQYYFLPWRLTLNDIWSDKTTYFLHAIATITNNNKENFNKNAYASQIVNSSERSHLQLVYDFMQWILYLTAHFLCHANTVSLSSPFFSEKKTENYTFYIYGVKCLLIFILNAFQFQWIFIWANAFLVFFFSFSCSIRHFFFACSLWQNIANVSVFWARCSSRLRHTGQSERLRSEWDVSWIYMNRKMSMMCLSSWFFWILIRTFQRECHFYESLSNIFMFTFFASHPQQLRSIPNLFTQNFYFLLLLLHLCRS